MLFSHFRHLALLSLMTLAVAPGCQLAQHPLAASRFAPESWMATRGATPALPSPAAQAIPTERLMAPAGGHQYALVAAQRSAPLRGGCAGSS